MQHRFSRGLMTAALPLFTVLAACSGNDSSSAGSGDGPSGPTEGPSGPTGPSGDPSEPGSCVETVRVPEQSYGENSDDMIRHLEFDAATGDLYYSILADMYVLPSGASEPRLLGARPNDSLYGWFWLTDDRILFPSGSLVPLIEGTVAALHSTDRELADPQVVIGLPVPESYNYQYEVADVFVRGDEVIWLGLDKYTDNPARIPVEWETTSVLRRTSWRNPGEPEDIYSTTRFVRSVRLAGDTAFLDEEFAAFSSDGPGEYAQTIVDLASGTADAQTAEEKFGGTVVTGDADSIFVARVDLDDLENIGLFRMTKDGSEAERLTTNPFVDRIIPRGDNWIFLDPQAISDPILVNEYTIGQGVTQLGCIDGVDTTAHSLALEGNTPLVAIFRGNVSSVLKIEN